MKNVSISHLPVILLLLVTVAASCSQNLVPQTSAPKPNTAVLASNEEASEPVSKSEVNSKVVKGFYKSYGDQEATNWYRSSRGFSVSFENSGVKTLVYYTPGGLEESRTRFYFEKNLPAEVRHAVKSNFYDYAILYVTEVQKNDAVAYFIKMQDSTTIKTIRVVNEECEVMETLARR